MVESGISVVYLDCRGLDQYGNSFAIELKAWVHKRPMVLWELRRFAKWMFPKRKKLSLNKLIKEQKGLWRRYWDILGCQEDAIIPSRRACEASNVAMNGLVHDEYPAGTKASLLFVACASYAVSMGDIRIGFLFLHVAVSLSGDPW